MPKVLERWEVMDHGELIEIDDGILTVAGTITMPLGTFPRRMTVVRLASGGTAIWSAVALNEPEMARIEAMGTPALLIVPSDGHRLDAKIWKQRYPDLRVVAPPGAKAAVEEAVPVDATDDALGDPAVRFMTMPGTGEHEAALVIERDGGDDIGRQRPDRQSAPSRRHHAACHGAVDGVRRVRASGAARHPAQGRRGSKGAGAAIPRLGENPQPQAGRSVAWRPDRARSGRVLNDLAETLDA